MIITVQNPIDWAAQVYKETQVTSGKDGLSAKQLMDFDDNPVIILKVLILFFIYYN